MKQKLSLALILVLKAVLYVGSKSWWSQRLFWNITSNDALMFTYSNTSLSLNSLLRCSHPIFDQPGPGDVMIYSILFKFPASWWITSHRLLTSSTMSATFSALHGTHVKVPKNNDVMDLVISSQRLDESYHIVHSLLQQGLPLSLRCTVLKQHSSWKHTRVPSGSIFLRQAITLLIIPFILTLFCSLISFFFLFSSNISQVT